MSFEARQGSTVLLKLPVLPLYQPRHASQRYISCKRPNQSDQPLLAISLNPERNVAEFHNLTREDRESDSAEADSRISLLANLLKDGKRMAKREILTGEIGVIHVPYGYTHQEGTPSQSAVKFLFPWLFKCTVNQIRCDPRSGAGAVQVIEGQRGNWRLHEIRVYKDDSLFFCCHGLMSLSDCRFHTSS